MKGYIYIALPTDGNMNSIKIGYTTNSLRERMQKGAKSRKFSIVAAVGVNDEDYLMKCQKNSREIAIRDYAIDVVKNQYDVLFEEILR